MRQLGNLIKKDIQNSFLTKIGYYAKTKGERKKLLGYLFLGVMFGFYMYLILKYVIDWISAYDDIGKGNVYLLQAVVAYTFITIFTLIPLLISNLYYSNDISILLPLPIKKSEILFSKMIYNSIVLLPTAIVMVLPFLIRYGIFYDKSVYFYIKFILAFLAHNMIVIAVFTFVVILLMSVINKNARAKNALQFLGTMLLMVLMFGISYFSNMNGGGEGIPTSVAQGIADKMESIINIVPSIKGIDEILGRELIYLPVLIVVAIALTYLVSAFSGGLLTKGVLNNQQVVKRRKLSLSERSNVFKRESHFKILYMKDLKDILKTPVYATNTLMMGLIIPIAFAIPLFAQKDSLQGIEMIPQFLTSLEQAISKESLFTYILLGVLAILMFTSSAGINTAGSSLTREGKQMWLMQVLPISPRDQVLSRVSSAFTVYLISLIPITLLIFILFKPALYLALAYILAVIAVGMLVTNAGLMKDIAKPKLDWDTPQKAMKSNFSLVVLTYATMILAGLIGFMTYKVIISNLQDRQKLILALAVILILIIISMAIYAYNIKQFKKKLPTY